LYSDDALPTGASIMSVLTASTEFAKALAPLLWPVVVIVIFLSARTKIYALLNRQTVSVKVGGFELNVADATQSIGESVADLQQRLSNLEVRLAGEGGTAGPGRDRETKHHGGQPNYDWTRCCPEPTSRRLPRPQFAGRDWHLSAPATLHSA